MGALAGARRLSTGPVPGYSGVAAAGIGLLLIAIQLAAADGWRITLLTMIAVPGLGAVCAGLVALAFPHLGLGVRVVLSAILGLCAAAIAVWLSGVADWFWLRWVLLPLPLLAWLRPETRRVWAASMRPSAIDTWIRRRGVALWGLGIACALAAVSLHGYFEPSQMEAEWTTYYVDIPWHIALTAESLSRAPTVYPWIPDVGIGYSWLTFGALGLVGNLTGATAAQLVLTVGPAFLAVVFPCAVAALAWVSTRSVVAAGTAPLLFELARSPIFWLTGQITPQWVLINRDFSGPLILAVVLILVLRTPTPFGAPAAALGVGRLQAWASLGLLFAIAFVASGSRGGAVAPLVGAVGLLWLLTVVLRQGNWRTATWSLVAVAAGILGSTLGVTKSSGSFRLDPFSFRGTTTVGDLELPIAAMATVLAAVAMIAAVAVTAWLDRRFRQASPAILGGMLAAVGGLAVFGHPSFSQLYFFHGAWPLFVVGLSALLALATRRFGALVGIGFGMAVIAMQLAITPPVPGIPWPVRLLVAGAAAAVALGLPTLRRRGRVRALPATAVVAALAVFSAQPWALPKVEIPAAYVDPGPTERTVSAGQLRLLDELRRRSASDDLVMTNKHCAGGDVKAGDCEARWWAVSAFAERRVLVEGYSYDYTWASSGTDNVEPYWNPELLRANDEFIAAPTADGCERFAGLGVRWIFVDKREAWSAELAEVATLVDESGDAALYRLEPGCI